MTPAQHVLLDAAKAARDYFERKALGMPPRGMYEAITIGRDLEMAIKAVERELEAESAAQMEAGL